MVVRYRRRVMAAAWWQRCGEPQHAVANQASFRDALPAARARWSASGVGENIKQRNIAAMVTNIRWFRQNAAAVGAHAGMLPSSSCGMAKGGRRLLTRDGITRGMVRARRRGAARRAARRQKSSVYYKRTSAPPLCARIRRRVSFCTPHCCLIFGTRISSSLYFHRARREERRGKRERERQWSLWDLDITNGILSSMNMKAMYM